MSKTNKSKKVVAVENKPASVKRKQPTAGASQQHQQPEPKASRTDDAAQYETFVAQLGGPLLAAHELGIAPLTVTRRATDQVPISKEAMIAIKAVLEAKGIAPGVLIV